VTSEKSLVDSYEVKSVDESPSIIVYSTSDDEYWLRVVIELVGSGL
jgi:hypothetical protein